MNPPTEFLLRLFGPVFLVIGVGMVLNPKQYVTMFKNLKTDTITFYLIAVMPLSIGIVLVQVHNVWNTLDEVLVSLIGWAALVKGIVRFLKPDFCIKVITSFAKPKNLAPSAWVIIILGGYMCYAGFFA